jgi:hypothetical protein
MAGRQIVQHPKTPRLGFAPRCFADGQQRAGQERALQVTSLDGPKEPCSHPGQQYRGDQHQPHQVGHPAQPPGIGKGDRF